MNSKDLDQIVRSTTFIPKYVEAVSFLESSGLLTYLRRAGLKSIHGETMEAAALRGSYAAGWHDALELLMNFTELVLAPSQNKIESPRADFGSLGRAYEQGDIDKEEQEAIKNGQQPDYRRYYTKPDTSVSTAGKPTTGNKTL